MDFESYRDSEELVEEKKSANCLRPIFCSSPFTKYVLPTFAIALVVLISVHFGMLAWLPQDDSKSQFTCHLQTSYYVPCLPGKMITMSECLELGCCWRDDLKVCYHTFPSRYGYKLDVLRDGTDKEGTILATRKTSPVGKPIRQKLAFRVHQINNHRVRISLKTNVNNDGKLDAFSSQRWAEKMKSNKLEDFGNLFHFLPRNDKTRISKLSLGGASKIDVMVHEPDFSITLARSERDNSTGKNSALLSTARGPLIVTDNYWEWTLYLTSATLYGLNNLDLNGTSNWIYNNENATIKPAFIAIDPYGNAMSCFVDYDGPLEVQVLNGSNLVILRGMSVPEDLSIEVMDGPTALQAIQQLAGASANSSRTKVLKKYLQGLHICPETRNSQLALESLKESISSMKTINAPWDSHCFYRQLSLALDHELNDDYESLLGLVTDARKLLRDDAKCLATHLTPMLYDTAESALRRKLEEESCLLGNRSGVYTGLYNGESVVYPNWMKEKTRNLTLDSLLKYNKDLSPDFIVLRDSWPKDEAKNVFTNNQFDYLPEDLQLLMSRGTIPWNLGDKHYAHHNSYANEFSAFVDVHSTLVELQGQACNSVVAEANWSLLRKILQTGVLSAMQGHLPTAMYVCGAEDANRKLDDELCVRWYGLAVAWPRIMALPEKSPASKKLSRNAATQAARLLRLRASLSTYQHTVLANYVKTGAPIFSTTSVYYPNEDQPRNVSINSQFLWGDSILVGLVVLPRRAQVRMWLPGNHPWKLLQGGASFDPTRNGTVSISAAISEVIMLVRPGRIVPVHQEKDATLRSTSETMLRNLRLLVNLVCMERVPCQAEGSIYYGDDIDGDFLLLKVLRKVTYPFRTLLSLKNVLNVQMAAACNTSTRNQATIIDTLELLGNNTFTINRDLCDIRNDSITITCEELEEQSFKCT